MPKISSFKGCFGKEHGKRAQTFLKFAWQHLYQIYWSLWRQLTCKKSLLMIWKISRLCPNSLSSYGKKQFKGTILDAIISKLKNFFWIFFYIFEIQFKFSTFSKKRWLSWLMYFRNYWLRKMWLDKCLKIPVWEDPSKGNMLNGTKYVEIWMTALLPYLLINVKAIDLEKVSLYEMQNLKTVF